MAKKVCLAKHVIAALAAGEIRGRRRQAALKHIARCASCRTVARKCEQLAYLLDHTKKLSDGSLAVDLPEVDAAFRQNLKQVMAREFERSKSQRERLQEFIESTVAAMLRLLTAPNIGMATLGYRSSASAQARSADLRRQLLANILRSLLETLLDPAIPLEQRVAWGTSLNSTLAQMKRTAAKRVKPIKYPRRKASKARGRH